MFREACECTLHELHVVSTMFARCLSPTFFSTVADWLVSLRVLLTSREAHDVFTVLALTRLFSTPYCIECCTIRIPTWFHNTHSFEDQLVRHITLRTTCRDRPPQPSQTASPSKLNADDCSNPHKPPCPRNSRALTASRSPRRSSVHQTWSVWLALFSPLRMSISSISTRLPRNLAAPNQTASSARFGSLRRRSRRRWRAKAVMPVAMRWLVRQRNLLARSVRARQARSMVMRAR